MLTKRSIVHDAVRKGLAFRIAAPLATQGTTFIENKGPYSVSVVRREPLDIKDHPTQIDNSV
jgi:hypothetical protein